MHTDVDASRKGPGLRRSGVAGVALGLLALVACELPFILTFIGLGSLGAAALPWKPPVYVELAGIIIGVAGLMLFFTSAARRQCSTKKRNRP